MRYSQVILFCDPKVPAGLRWKRCPVCDCGLGAEPRLMSTDKGQEWICSGCCGQVMSALEQQGRERFRRFINSRMAL